MIFNEVLYPVFLALCVLVFHLFPRPWRHGWLFFSGVLFYGYYAHEFLYLFIAQIAIVYFFCRQPKQSKAVFFTALLTPVLTLIYFKYKNMGWVTLHEALRVFRGNELPAFPYLVLPLAISFFTFEFVHYVSDHRAQKLPPHALKEFLSFIMFFPTMVAGPIKRFQQFAPQVETASLSYEHLNAGVWRILTGYAKKMVIADTLDLWVQPLMSSAGIASTSGTDLWIGLLAYSFKIYADFSGYSDIAIGSARLFGIVVPENFLVPYLKPNIGLFWRHWHISLTRWLIDYMYIPLGGNRKGLLRTCLYTILTMLVSGLWHGAAWHFVAWGAYHGFLLSGYRMYHQLVGSKMRLPPAIQPAGAALSTAFTFFLVTLGWGFFILPMGDFAKLLSKLIFLNSGG